MRYIQKFSNMEIKKVIDILDDLKYYSFSKKVANFLIESTLDIECFEEFYETGVFDSNYLLDRKYDEIINSDDIDSVFIDDFKMQFLEKVLFDVVSEFNKTEEYENNDLVEKIMFVIKRKVGC